MNRYRQRDATPISLLPKEDPLHGARAHVITLVVIYFTLSVLFFILTAITDAQHPNTVTFYLWGRVITEIILGVAYFLFVYLWQRGKFWGYLRMLMTSALALVSALSVIILEGAYPWWLRVEQIVQLIAIIALVYILTRSDIRVRFRKKLPVEKLKQ